MLCVMVLGSALFRVNSNDAQASKISNNTNITAVSDKQIHSLNQYTSRAFTVGKSKQSDQREINSKNPLLLLIMRDESQTMGLEYLANGRKETKGDVTTRGINLLLNDIVLRLLRTDAVGKATIKPYVNVAVIGYNGDAAGNRLEHITGKRPPGATPPPHKFIVSLEELMAHPLRNETLPPTDDDPDAPGEEIQVFLDNFTPGANTPMRAGMKLAHRIAKKHIEQFPEAHAPLLVNITDGMSTDGSPVEVMKSIRETPNTHGENVILMNVNISSSPREAIYFPNHEDELAPEITGEKFAPYARMLFHGSSQIPEPWVNVLDGQGYAVTNASKALLFNAPIEQIHKILQMGTRATLAGTATTTTPP